MMTVTVTVYHTTWYNTTYTTCVLQLKCSVLAFHRLTLHRVSVRMTHKCQWVNECMVQSEGCMVQAKGCMVQAKGCMVQPEGCMVQPEGCMVQAKKCFCFFLVNPEMTS